MFVNILIINICYHDNLHACKGTRRVLFFYDTWKSAISWDVLVPNQCTSDKKMLIFSYISLVSLCLFSMASLQKKMIDTAYKQLSISSIFLNHFSRLCRSLEECITLRDNNSIISTLSTYDLELI